MQALFALGLSGATCTPRPPATAPIRHHLDTCVALLQQGEVERAESHCSLCLEVDERSPACLNAMGLVAFARGDDERARTHFTHCIREDQDMGQCRNNLGVLELEVRRPARAAELFESALEIDPFYLDARYNLGLARFRQGRLEAGAGGDPEPSWRESEAHYRKLAELAPADPRAFRDLGVLEAHRADRARTGPAVERHVAEAESRFRACLERDPDEEGCLEGLGHLLLRRGRYREARELLERCVTTSPGHPACLGWLSEASAAQGVFDAASAP